MSDNMLLHFSSNSSIQSNQSLPTKIVKLEVRMVGKVSSVSSTPVQQQQQTPSWSSVSPSLKFGAYEEFEESSDSDDAVSFRV